MKNCSNSPVRAATPQQILDKARALGRNFATRVTVCSRSDFTAFQFLTLSWRSYTGLVFPPQETLVFSAAFPLYTVAVVDEKPL